MKKLRKALMNEMSDSQKQQINNFDAELIHCEREFKKMQNILEYSKNDIEGAIKEIFQIYSKLRTSMDNNFKRLHWML